MKTVDRGAALLDEEYGPAWDKKINLERLNLASPCNCVLGQLHPRASSPYMRGLDRLGFGHMSGKPEAHGFHVRRNGRWDNLTDAWRELIEARRKARTA
ncbi:MAG: hypothetical protein H0U82_11830 [Actinobacteria bacterium]|nr:hypothetical protein [Actinomycetota bacterium]